MRPVPSHLAVLALIFAARAAFASEVVSEPVSEPVPANVLGRESAGELVTPARLALPADRVLHDVDEHGALWTSTAHYKASFDAAGATFVPFLGSSAPRNFPVGVALQNVRVGGADLELEPTSPTRSADRVEYERGALREVYALTPNAMEQSFVFDVAPGSGDLVLDVHIETELEQREDATGFTLANDLGGVSISRAVAFDAAGCRLDLATTWTGAGYSIRVPEAFVASARYPLVVDPSFVPLTVGSTTYDLTVPDVTSDPVGNRGGFVFEAVFSAVDHDVYVVLLSPSGTGWVITPIDLTNQDLRRPSIAIHARLRRFLVVAETGIAPFRSIRGRVCASDLSWIYPVMTISTGSGDHTWPDVGGEARLDVSGRFCVVWQRELSSTQIDIAARVIDGDGLFSTGMIALQSASGLVGRHPSISKSTGDANTPHGWVTVWDRTVLGSDRDIVVRQISATGVTLPPFVAAPGTADDAYPSVSSLTMADADVVYMIAFQRYVAANERDVLATIAVENAPVATYVLTPNTAAAQIAPAVETDGHQFFMVHMDPGTGGSTTHDLRLLQWAWNGSSLTNTAVTTLGAAGVNDMWPQIALDRSSGGAGSDGFVTWQADDGTGSDEILGAHYTGQVGGPSFLFCRGDGAEGACPCGNFGSFGHGCANSASANGALLFATGQHSTTADTTRLELVEATPTTTCLFFQGTASSASTSFGDGLRCVSGQVIRLGTHTTSLGATSYPGPTDAPIHSSGQVPNAGARRYYQVWYRNAAAYCTSSTFNLSNGVIIDWTR